MSEFAFWNNWAKPYKTLFLVLLALLVGSIFYFLAVMWIGAELVIDWQTLATLENIQLPLYELDHPLMDIELETAAKIVRQTFWGSELQINLWPAHLLLLMVSLGLAVALAVITGLNRFWYLVGTGLFCLIIVSLGLEHIQLFGRMDKTADVLLFLLFLPLSYYFQAVNTSVSLVVRVLVFLALFVLMGLLIYFFSAVEVPFLYIANYGLPAFLGLSFLLILLIAPEIIAGILYLVTASNNESSENSLTHFVLASSIYLANLLLYYLEIKGILDLDLYLITPFWLLPLSMLVALWTLKDRSVNFENIIPWQPLGGFLYLALCIICLGTIGYVFATANDPLIETFEDAILYAHLGLGVFFFLYVIVNFLGLLKENKRVYRVVYKPRVMPLFSARLVGLIAVLGLFSLHGMFAIFQPMGGYYNGIGDLYLADNNYFLAEQYYKLGSQHKYANHRSNYALASLARKVDKPIQAMLFLKEAIERHPTPYAYANLANLYFENNHYFDGLFILREGIKRFPEEGRLYSNLGVQFGRTNVLDSAIYYLEVARQDSEIEVVAAANALGLLAQKKIPLPADSLTYEKAGGDIFYQNNLLALYNLLEGAGKVPERVNPKALQELGGIESSWLLNYSMLVQEPDSALPRQIRQLIDSTTISYYEEPAGLALGLLLYKQQNHFGAFRQLEELAFRSQLNSSLYLKLLGGWALEQEAPLMASNFFGQAGNRGDAEAVLLHALALTEAGKPLEASEVLINLPDSLLNQSLRTSKAEMLLLLNTQNFSDYRGNVNEGAFKALRLQWGRLNVEQIQALLARIQDKEWKARALAWLAKGELKRGEPEEAAMYIQQLQQLHSRYPGLAGKEEFQILTHRIDSFRAKEVSAPNPQLYPATLGKLYAQATKAVLARDTLQALQFYRQIMQATPFMESAYLAAVPLFNAKGLEEEAYGFLLKALQFNQYSVPLRKEYILQSLRIGLESYGRDELEVLRQVLDKERYEKFLQRFEEERKLNPDFEENW